MTQCNKIQESLTFWVLGELGEDEAREVAGHLQSCGACRAEAQAYQEMVGMMRAEDLPGPGVAFFSAQREAILAQVPSDGSVPDIEISEAEIAQISDQLRQWTVPDPGDLFFYRQSKAIRRSLGEAETPRWSFGSLWLRPLAAAAALFFLVLGVARITHHGDVKSPPGWNLALEQLAEEELPSLDDIEEMDNEQLQRLAGNLEGAILVESGDQLADEPVEFDDLNEQELDFLIERLEAEKQT